jgi:SOS-response transcriptional repressor LexA
MTNPTFCCKECGQKLPESREPLTPRQMEALEAIRFSYRVVGVAPSYTALAKKLGLRSLASVWELVQKLEQKGYVTRKPGEYFGIRLT